METNIIENFIYDDEIEIYNDYNGFCLTKRKSRKGNNVYTIYDMDDYVIGDFVDPLDVKNLIAFETTSVYKKFKKIVDEYIEDTKKGYFDNPNYGNTDYWDDMGYDAFGELRNVFKGKSYPTSSYHYEPPKKSTGFLDKLNKSNTLVVHCKDSTTEMLGQIYENKGWDVLRDGNIDKEELHELIKKHERIICLGHGSSYGLFNKQGGGYVIGDEEVPFLKGKQMFVVWCYASEYFKRHGIGKGNFVSKNVPSEKGEAAAIGANVTADWILKNITYWSKCCADIAEDCLSGNGEAAVKRAQAEYQKSKTPESTPDEIKVIDYNTDAMQILK